MTYLELFAGCGGMSLGLHRAGLEPVALVEWDKSAAGVLAHHWPTVPLFCDVTKFAGAEVQGRVDLLAFGSPCQDLSVAGKRRGLAKGSGTRSSLFHDAIRIAAQLRVHNGLRYLLWENVVGALSSNKGADFAAVLGEMADLGARDIAWRVLDSQWFGVAQRRRRVFVVADLGGERAAEILALAQGLSGHPAPRREAGERPAGTLSARTQGGGGLGTDTELDGGLVAFHPTQDPISSRGVSHALGCGSKGGTASVAVAFKLCGRESGAVPETSDVASVRAASGGSSRSYVATTTVRRLTPRECERLQGWPDCHTRYSQPLAIDGNRWVRLDKPPKEQADGPRYQQCGNGVTANVAEWIGRNMKTFSS